jgi:hypothetical protein
MKQTLKHTLPAIHSWQEDWKDSPLTPQNCDSYWIPILTMCSTAQQLQQLRGCLHRQQARQQPCYGQQGI